MKSLKIAASLSVRSCFDTEREVVNVLTTDFCDIGAVVVSVTDVNNGIVDKINNTGLKLPIFVAAGRPHECLHFHHMTKTST